MKLYIKVFITAFYGNNYQNESKKKSIMKVFSISNKNDGNKRVVFECNITTIITARSVGEGSLVALLCNKYTKEQNVNFY